MEKASGVLDGLLVSEGELVRDGLGSGDGSTGAPDGAGVLLGLLVGGAVGVDAAEELEDGLATGTDGSTLSLTVREGVAEGNSGMTMRERDPVGVREGTKDLEGDRVKETVGVGETRAKGNTVAAGEHILSTSNRIPTSPKLPGPVTPISLNVATPSVVSASRVPVNWYPSVSAEAKIVMGIVPPSSSAALRVTTRSTVADGTTEFGPLAVMVKGSCQRTKPVQPGGKGALSLMARASTRHSTGGKRKAPMPPEVL